MVSGDRGWPGERFRTGKGCVMSLVRRFGADESAEFAVVSGKGGESIREYLEGSCSYNVREYSDFCVEI